MKPIIQPFILTWRGQFENARAIERDLRQQSNNVTVINSDDTVTAPGWVNVGESSFSCEQFGKALELFTGDVLLLIQADARYDRWGSLFEDASRFFQTHSPGIYAPNVDYSWWTRERNDILSRRLEPAHLQLVACSDETVWFISRELLKGLRDRQIDLSDNTMGWGWSCLVAAISYLKGLPIIRDYNHTIQHPRETSYNIERAMAEMNAYLNSLDPEILQVYNFMRNDPEKLTSYLQAPADEYHRNFGTHPSYRLGSLPSKRLTEFYDLSCYDTFVETGTYLGDGVAWAIEHGFKRIYSVEASPELYKAACERFTLYPNVTIRLGDSSVFLRELVEKLSGPIFFYLDAHWSGEYKGIPTSHLNNVFVPLEKESRSLATYKDLSDSLIIIDDERLLVDPVNPPASWGKALKEWLFNFWIQDRGFFATYLDDSMIFEKVR